MSIDSELNEMPDPFQIKDSLRNCFHLHELGLANGVFSCGDGVSYKEGGMNIFLLGEALSNEKRKSYINEFYDLVLAAGLDIYERYFNMKRENIGEEFWAGVRKSLRFPMNNWSLRESKILKENPGALQKDIFEKMLPYLLGECDQYVDKLIDYYNKWNMYKGMFDYIEEDTAEIEKREDVLREAYGTLEE